MNSTNTSLFDEAMERYQTGTDANDLINQILDVLEIENPELYSKTMKQYQNGHMKDLVSTLDKHIEELDNLSDDEVLELLMQIVGDA